MLVNKGGPILVRADIVTRENIARCCAACNSSKGTKPLAAWIASQYCKTQGITKDTVAEVVKQALRISARAAQQQREPADPPCHGPCLRTARARSARRLRWTLACP